MAMAVELLIFSKNFSKAIGVKSSHLPSAGEKIAPHLRCSQ
jgi:hypothetical protein